MRWINFNDQVTIVNVVGLNSIFNEECVTKDIVGNVLHNAEVVDSVGRHCTVVGLMNGVTFDVGLVNSTDHVEMNRVPAELESLSDVGKLDVGNTTDCRFITR